MARVKKRLDKPARSTGRRSRSYLAAEAPNEHLDVNEWQVEGIRSAIASLDNGEGIAHEDIKRTIKSWERSGGRSRKCARS